jgi:hypothetical protein
MVPEPRFDLGAGMLAPEFNARSLSGGFRGLWQWRGQRVLLIFVQPHCPQSRRLLAAISGLLAAPAAQGPVPIIITNGTRAENHRMVDQLRIGCPVLMQDDLEISRSYDIRGTPSSRLIGEDGCLTGITQRGAVRVLTEMGVMPGPDWTSDTTRYQSVGNQFAKVVIPQVKKALKNPNDYVSLPEDGAPPLVSVVMPTRDRPALFALSLDCYRRQTYPRRELIVVDNGTRFPVDDEVVTAAGGRVIRVSEGTPLGAKLNRGVNEARGSLCQKWDDDDWYAPQFQEVLVAAYLGNNARLCRPTIAFQMRRLWFDLARWRMLGWSHEDVAGGTLLFAREDWKERPFREVQMGEDLWFLLDQMRAGASLLPVDIPELYVYVRHDTLDSDRQNTWTQWQDGRKIEQFLRYLVKGSKDPADVLPEWALSTYKDLRRSLK